MRPAPGRRRWIAMMSAAMVSSARMCSRIAQPTTLRVNRSRITARCHPDYDGHEALLFAQDTASGLRALIAIHNTALGPAFGGCRMYPYASEQQAMSDVLRLSRGMTYKAAICELPYGGGKSVIIGD